MASHLGLYKVYTRPATSEVVTAHGRVTSLEERYW